MTVAVGIIGSASGVVLAADTEMTWARGWKTIRTTDSGSFNESRDKTHAIGLCGAGNGDYFAAIGVQLLDEILDQDEWMYASVENLIEARLLDFYRKHVIPFQGQQDSPDIELLIALNGFGKCALWGTSRTTVRRCVGYEAIGVGRIYRPGTLIAVASPDDGRKIEYCSCHIRDNVCAGVRRRVS